MQEYGASRSVAPGEWRAALAELAAEGTGAAAAQVRTLLPPRALSLHTVSVNCLVALSPPLMLAVDPGQCGCSAV